jgi:hypothetical protein
VSGFVAFAVTTADKLKGMTMRKLPVLALCTTIASTLALTAAPARAAGAITIRGMDYFFATNTAVVYLTVQGDASGTCDLQASETDSDLLHAETGTGITQVACNTTPANYSITFTYIGADTAVGDTIAVEASVAELGTEVGDESAIVQVSLQGCFAHGCDGSAHL